VSDEILGTIPKMLFRCFAAVPAWTEMCKVGMGLAQSTCPQLLARWSFRDRPRRWHFNTWVFQGRCFRSLCGQLLIVSPPPAPPISMLLRRAPLNLFFFRFVTSSADGSNIEIGGAGERRVQGQSGDKVFSTNLLGNTAAAIVQRSNTAA